MNRIRGLLLLLCLAVLNTAWAATISERQARAIAIDFMAARSMPTAGLKTTHKAPMLDELAVPTGKIAYYVFNAAQPGKGFVIVAADDRVPAILGYSDSGSFETQDLPPAMQEWLDGYALQVEAIARGAAPELRFGTRTAIEPMLPVNWGQGLPYNVLLPHIKGSSNDHAYVGCVAVAMAQIMGYWQYPPRPTQTIPKYTSNIGSSYSVVMPALAPIDFDWDQMHVTYYTNDSTSEAALAVANLMLYSTTSVRSNFGLTSTSSYTSNIPEKLITYFGYKNSAHFLRRSEFATQAWEDTIYNELAAGRPVVYGGNKKSSGHAFVCDGYDGDGRFHINWGWAGKSNGYFLLSLLNPSDEGIGSAAGAYGYVYNQGIGIGIEPDDGTSGTASLSFEDLTYRSANTTRSAASSNFSLQVSGRFINNTNVSSRFRQGWGLYKDGELIEVLYTANSTSALGNGQYLTVSNRTLNFGAGITSGTYRIMPIYAIYPGDDYRPCIGSDVNYIEVTFGGAYSCTIKGYGTAGTTTRYTANSCTTEGTHNHGKPVTVNLNLTNTGTSTNDLIYMFVDGTFTGMGLANIAPGESGDLVYRFTPSTASTKTLTFSLNDTGTSPFYTHQVTINTMPAASLDVSYSIQGIIDEVNRIIVADSYSIVVDVTNTGTAPYNEDFSARLYRVNNENTATGTELLSMTQPLQLAPGESKTLRFDFDHDLIDGWKYFCYLYYYSAGETVSKGTRWYQLFFPDEQEGAHIVSTAVTPAGAGTITITGGLIRGKALAGDTVTFTVAPATGYALSTVMVNAGDEVIEISHDQTTGVYSFVMPNAPVVINASFDEIPAYHISASATPASGGIITPSTTIAEAGNVITITARANVGWALQGVTVTSEDGTPVELTDAGNGSYSFVMPEANVTVTAAFERNTGNIFEMVTATADITPDGTYVIATRYYDKAMKYHEAGEATFGATAVAEWLNEEKTRMRVTDNTCFIRMEAVNPDTIRHGATSGARTNAFLSTGTGFLTTDNGNLIVTEGCTNLNRAGMFISSNEHNYLVRFFYEATGATSDYMTVRYDYQGNRFRIINYSSDSQQRVWLYKLVDEPPTPYFIPGDVNNDGDVDVEDVTLLIKVILGNSEMTPYIMLAGNVIADDEIDVSDVTAIINIALGK